MQHSNFFNELKNTENEVNDFLFALLKSDFTIQPKILETCTRSYITKSGKKLRPTVLMLSCLAVGGSREKALPASAAVELFHTWTLVHDDIIDNDDLRRGVETVHITAKKYAQKDLNLNEAKAKKYGSDIAMLTGDVQHGWSIAILARELPKRGVRPEVVLHLLDLLQTYVLGVLVEGEVMDMDMGLKTDFRDITDDSILDMLWKKTGVLYEFCGIAGGLIGKNTLEYDDEINALKKFCSLCGTAFQIQDDILGLVGKETELGKPVGSDIREGKKTLLINEAMRKATPDQKELMIAVLGNSKADKKDISTVTDLVIELGGMAKAKTMAKKYITDALTHLEKIKPSASRDLLYEWADYLIERKF